MIIVSQNGKSIINFKNICKIDVNKWGENNFTIDCYDIDSFEHMLGEYKTEERAKEVLEKIIAFYEYKRVYECSEHRVSFTKVFVYEMPLE